MKFLDYLFHGKELKAIGNYFKMLNGYSPTFTSFSGGVYEMDLTRTAINNFATHCSKLKPEIEGSALKSLEKTLQHKPNYFMDTTKFIKRLATYVAVEHTAFIIPIEDEYGRLCGWYPLRAERCEVVESEGQLYLRYLFANGSYGAIEFERVGIMTDFEYKDDLFGEDNSTLAPTMQLIHTQNEGIINAVKNSANIRFLAKVANMLKPDDIKKERKRFTEDNLSADNDSGMIIYDNKFSELKQVESNGNMPDGVGIPVGNLTSQLFANIYLDALDQFIKHELGVEAYIRYMDDFVILSPDKEQLRSWLARIEQFLREELKLEFNPKTTILAAKNGIDFVGYKHRATHRKVRKDSIKRIKRTIKKCESGKITKEQLQKSIQSWTGHAGHADSYNLRKKIETLAEAALEKAA
nr:MAG: portal protein [Bacteriophage sp.]